MLPSNFGQTGKNPYDRRNWRNFLPRYFVVDYTGKREKNDM
jgi:hypothetical protein